MSYVCKILADSISDAGHRLTTFEVTFPRFVLAEFNTHRMLSRNSASSRAIPVEKSIQAVEDDPFVPEEFGVNQPGMSADNVLSDQNLEYAKILWMGARDAAIDYTAHLDNVKVHKGLSNRILEPFKWHTVIVTATDWSNFFALRTAENAQPEIRKIALMMQDLYRASQPIKVLHSPIDWHLPLIEDGEIRDSEDVEYWKKVSIGRCARVSYLTHHGERDPEADVALHDKLLSSGHLSPFEHVARPFNEDEWAVVKDVRSIMKRHHGTSFGLYTYDRAEYAGNLRGWWSARMDVPNESDYSQV